ncbi:hypothetical protein [Eubacterium sp.]
MRVNLVQNLLKIKELPVKTRAALLDINIVLELIARYVIELLNPELKNVVERRTAYYKENRKAIFEYENR